MKLKRLNEIVFLKEQILKNLSMLVNLYFKNVNLND